MWEDNRKQKIIINILLIFLIIVLLAALAVAVFYVRKTTKEHDEQLSTIQVQQQQEQTEARQESITAIQNEYEKDMQTVADYLPGIVCWGDSLTLGASGSTAYPYVLQKYIDTYICDIYDFRSTIENAEEYSRLKWDDYKVNIPVVNMGAGAENTSTILGRSGAVPYVTAVDMTIPAGVEAVSISFKSENGKSVEPLKGGNAGVNNVTINGIVGTIEIDAENNNYYGSTNYKFTRLEAGNEEFIPAGTVIKTAATDEYKDFIHIICIGTYGGFDTVDEIVNQTKELIARQTQNSDRFIVIGLCSYNGYTASTYILDSIDTAMMQAFGNRYINVRKYLCGDGLIDAKISKTTLDVQSVDVGAVPPSFLASSHSVELNGLANKLLGKLIFGRMDSLGYFDEIYSELGITETTKQILKTNPDYFENIIKNVIK